MTETLTDSGAVKIKAGANASTTITNNAATMTSLINTAEAFISVNSKFDWVANYSGADSNTKLILGEIASSLAAISVINYDMSGYTSRTEAQTMLDVNWTKVVEGINILREEKYKDFTYKGDLN